LGGQLHKYDIYVNNMIQLLPEEDVISMSIWKEIRKTYRYEMKPTKNQKVKVIKTLNTIRRLHNDSLAERKDGWKNGGWSVRYEDQQSHLTMLRNKNDEFGKDLRNIYTDVEQDAIRRVDIGYQRFFKRVKDNKNNPVEYNKPGHPRFKGRNRYKSLTFTRY
jgi:putative transposase